MYIPTTFMASQGSCFTITTSTLGGNGLVTSGSFVSGGVIWDYYQFEMTDKEDPTLTSFTASFNVLSGSTGQAKILVVGGGGTGGNIGSINDGSDQNWAVTTAGGGGAGGVVYYNQFPISSGSYQIGIGKATAGPGGYKSTGAQISGFLAGVLGQPSWLKLPSNRTYTPFPSSYIIGFGGGGASTQGTYSTVTPRRVNIRDFVGQSSTSSLLLGDLQNGSGGGGCNVPSSTLTGGTPGANGGMAAGGVDLGGLNGADQGFAGGTALGGRNIDGFCINGVGVGGGGASEAGPNRQLVAGGADRGPGGNGVLYNLTGTPTYYAGGGGGDSQGSGGAPTGRGLGDYGCGGNGQGVGSLYNGQAGVVIITLPRCFTNSANCREYRISGGATGGTVTYIPCNTTTPISTSIDFGYTGSMCVYKIGGYPTSTGTVTLTETGSCNTFIPIAPSVTCPTGSVKTPVYIFDWSIPGQCYPSQTSCQRLFYPSRVLNYVDVNSVSQSVVVGGWFNNGSGQVCAKATPAPTISAGSVTNSGLICGYFCSGSV